MQLHVLADVLGNIRQILLVLLREDHFTDAVAVRREQLLF